jgi:hypothetical protein
VTERERKRMGREGERRKEKEKKGMCLERGRKRGLS